MNNRSILKRYGYVWVTLVFFLFSLVGHWTAAWYAYLNDQEAHHQPVEVSEYMVEVTRDTFENWQSEFLQLIWLVAGLAFLWYLGSPQSKEGTDRLEEKVDALLTLNGRDGKKVIATLDKKYPRQ